MQDAITREITVKASQERVYQAITDPKQITAWFPDAIEGALEVGARPIFTFTDYDHRVELYIEAATPHEYFAYRWVPGGQSALGDVLKVPNTLVEFFIEEDGAGSKITLKESGFASLPPEAGEAAFKDNTGGWEHMMTRLQKVLDEA